MKQTQMYVCSLEEFILVDVVGVQDTVQVLSDLEWKLHRYL